jgi:hypothetical protein
MCRAEEAEGRHPPSRRRADTERRDLPGAFRQMTLRFSALRVETFYREH